MRQRTVGIVGYGHFGQFIHELMLTLTPLMEVRVYSSRAEPDGKTFFSLEEVAASDVVILCCAIHDFEKHLVSLLPYVRPETIIIDVSTVKKYTSELLRKHAGNHHFIATHPMFGPESYRKCGNSVQGFRIVVTDYAVTNDQYLKFRSLVEGLGFAVIEMSADEHDRTLARTLFLTHLIGQTVLAADFGRTSIDTVSFGFLMDAVESVQHDTKLFQDVFRFNPYCKAVLDEYDAAERKVIETILNQKDLGAA